MGEPGGPRPARCDRGTAALVLTVMLGLVVIVASAVLGVTRFAAARGQAATAADLAALSAAASGDCESARRAASMNAAVLRSCEAVGQDFEVSVEVEVVLAARHTRSVTAFARAGPPE